jgi:glycosyltransferase involved in cell wall biosynthesis
MIPPDVHLRSQFVGVWPTSQLDSWMKCEFESCLVTVIIPAFQRESLIECSIRSVGNQTYRPIELIVVDDGSTDQTGSVAQRIGAEFETAGSFRFRYILQDNSGAPTARNRGLVEAAGEFIQFLDSDDLLHPQKLSAAVNALREHKDCQTACCPLLRFHESDLSELETQETIETVGIPKVITENIFEPAFLPVTGLHRRTLLQTAGPWVEKLTRWQDLEYQVRLAFCLRRYIWIETPMYFFRQHDGERIHSQYKQQRGLASGFDSLEMVERTLEVFHHRDENVKRELSQFYVSLAVLAARCSSKADLGRAIDGALRNRSGYPFWLRLKLFQVIAILFGGRAAARLSDIYTGQLL